MTMEAAVLAEAGREHENLALRILAVVAIATWFGQLIGVVLVALGRYRTGGVMQICASALHVIELFGIIGILGGLRAYHYAPNGEQRR
jgi:hypothetical protein